MCCCIATMEVKEDFYVYKTGVYRSSMPADYMTEEQRKNRFHSVRLLGYNKHKLIYIAISKYCKN